VPYRRLDGANASGQAGARDFMTDLSNQTEPPESSRNVSGRIHSVSALGTGPGGPGVRFVIFLDGCPLRCTQCAEPGSTLVSESEPRGRGGAGGIDSLMQQIARYADYMRVSGGGVTVAGAEPLDQAAFIRELFRRCRDMGIAPPWIPAGAETCSRPRACYI
jgi:pyruvate formate lyase activating enzyme